MYWISKRPFAIPPKPGWNGFPESHSKPRCSIVKHSVINTVGTVFHVAWSVADHSKLLTNDLTIQSFPDVVLHRSNHTLLIGSRCYVNVLKYWASSSFLGPSGTSKPKNIVMFPRLIRTGLSENCKKLFKVHPRKTRFFPVLTIKFYGKITGFYGKVTGKLRRYVLTIKFYGWTATLTW